MSSNIFPTSLFSISRFEISILAPHNDKSNLDILNFKLGKTIPWIIPEPMPLDASNRLLMLSPPKSGNFKLQPGAFRLRESERLSKIPLKVITKASWMPFFIFNSMLLIPPPKISPISGNWNSPKSKLGLTSLILGNSKLALSLGNSKSRSIFGSLFNSFSLVKFNLQNSNFISGNWKNLSYTVKSLLSNSLKNISIARENSGIFRLRKNLQMSILISGSVIFGSLFIFNSGQRFENSGSPSVNNPQIIFAAVSSWKYFPILKFPLATLSIKVAQSDIPSSESLFSKSPE